MAENESRREYAFVSDIHSNLEALEAVMEKVGDLPVFCLGDSVGYGASPNQVLDLLRERGATMIIGNHDFAALTSNVSDFNSRAAVAAVWTSRQLTPDNRRFLAELPRERRLELNGTRLYMTHASPDDNLWEYVYPGTHSDIFGYYLKRLGVDVIALGHTHIPFSWTDREGTVFNPGSVGQPRDGDPKASCAILSIERSGVRKVEHFRVEYDVRSSAQKIREAGLPGVLAERLFSGQ